MIDGHANLELIGAKLKDPHSDAGGPSIDPELQLRLLLVGYLYGVTSETKLMGKSSCAYGVALVHRGFGQEIPAARLPLRYSRLHKYCASLSDCA